jgi:GNAT superfamily N-acetyltransferase
LRPTPDHLTLRMLDAAERTATAAILADGMRDNPMELAALADDAARREQQLVRLFRPTVAVPAQRCLGAFAGENLVGAAVFAPPKQCQPPVRSAVRMAGAALALGPRAARRLASWQLAWRRRDPAEVHNHLLLLAVRRDSQRQRIGTALLAEYCARVDESGDVAYLETDTESNVRFYAGHGFVVVDEARVLGQDNWFMRRTKP